jgi:glycosyltransferase involved in cell wall biosynthesis
MRLCFDELTAAGFRTLSADPDFWDDAGHPMTPRPDILYLGILLGHGGDAKQLLELAGGMVQRGARVQAVVPLLETTRGFAEQGRKRGIDVVRTPWLRSNIMGARQNPLNVLRLFHTYRAPLLHLHTGDCCLPRTVVLAMRALRLPRAFVTVQNAHVSLTPGEPRALAWATAVERQVELLVCPSNHSRRSQLAFGVSVARVRVIHNSVDLSRFGGGVAQKARNALGVDEDTPLVVFTSRLDEVKRPLDAIEAFARVAPDFPSAQLVFVGQGNLEEGTRAAAKRLGLTARVRFVGYQDNVEDWLAAATVWILPTERENFSLAVLEAMAAGRAIVSTMSPGNDEVLIDGDNALTNAVGDLAAMAASLHRLLSDPPLRARLGAAARATAHRYASERMVDAYAECYSRRPKRLEVGGAVG